MIAGRRKERLRAAVPDHRAGVGEEAFRLGDALHRIGDRLGPAVVVIGEALDLLAVEDGVGLEEGDVPFDLAAMRVDFCFGEAAGVDDGRAGFVLSHMRAEFGGLSKGHPHRRGEAARHSLRPEEQHVQARVGLTAMAQRSRDAAAGVARSPWLDPWTHALFEIGDDALGDAGVDVGARAGFLGRHFPVLRFGAAPIAARRGGPVPGKSGGPAHPTRPVAPRRAGRAETKWRTAKPLRGPPAPAGPPSGTGARAQPFPSPPFLAFRRAATWEQAGPVRDRPVRLEEEARPKPRPMEAQPRAAICISAALRSSVWPGFSTGRSKGFQRSPTTCS